MKRTIQTLISLVVAMSTLLLASGCAPAAQGNQTGPVKLSIWINGRDSFIGPSEQKLAQDQWYITPGLQAI